jgi:hypothetical protein
MKKWQKETMKYRWGHAKEFSKNVKKKNNKEKKYTTWSRVLQAQRIEKWEFMRIDQFDNYPLFLYSRNAQQARIRRNQCSMSCLYTPLSPHSATFILFKDALFFTHGSATCDDLSSWNNKRLRLHHVFVENFLWFFVINVKDKSFRMEKKLWGVWIASYKDQPVSLSLSPKQLG